MRYLKALRFVPVVAAALLLISKGMEGKAQVWAGQPVILSGFHRDLILLAHLIPILWLPTAMLLLIGSLIFVAVTEKR
jgi:hypothetical protein